MKRLIGQQTVAILVAALALVGCGPDETWCEAWELGDERMLDMEGTLEVAFDGRRMSLDVVEGSSSPTVGIRACRTDPDGTSWAAVLDADMSGVTEMPHTLQYDSSSKEFSFVLYRCEGCGPHEAPKHVVNASQQSRNYDGTLLVNQSSAETFEASGTIFYTDELGIDGRHLVADFVVTASARSETEACALGLRTVWGSSADSVGG